jgi:hypothetical protein
MLPEEVKAMTGWINTKDVQGQIGLPRNDPQTSSYSQSNISTVKAVNVWELWGQIPKSLITGNSEDKDTEIDGHIVVSGLERMGTEKVHLIEENKKGLKPYEEC